MSLDGFLDCLHRLQDHQTRIFEENGKEVMELVDESLDEETHYEIVLVTSDPNGDVGFFFDTRFGLIHAHFKRSFRQGVPGYRIDNIVQDMEYCLANFERRTGFEGIDFGKCNL